MTNIRKTQKWRKLSAKVIAAQPVCQIGLPGCTIVSTTGDHIIPVVVAPELALEPSNVQGACRWCNERRGNRDLVALRPSKALAFFD